MALATWHWQPITIGTLRLLDLDCPVRRCWAELFHIHSGMSQKTEEVSYLGQFLFSIRMPKHMDLEPFLKPYSTEVFANLTASSILRRRLDTCRREDRDSSARVPWTFQQQPLTHPHSLRGMESLATGLQSLELTPCL